MRACELMNLDILLHRRVSPLSVRVQSTVGLVFVVGTGGRRGRKAQECIMYHFLCLALSGPTGV